MSLKMRRLLPAASPPTQPLITTSWNGYTLTIGHNDLDVLVFDRLARDGRARLATGDAPGAYEMLETALRLWRGEPLHGIDLLGDLASWAERLREEHLSVSEDLFDVKLMLGRHSELIGHLQTWTTEHQLRERSHAQLMLALHRSGRQAEALEAYQRLRRTLVTHVGAEPGVTVRDLHQRMLRADPELMAEPTMRERLKRVSAVTAGVGRVAPASAALPRRRRLRSSDT